MCKKHNKYYRAGLCPLCVQAIEESIQLDFEIRMLEKENRELNFTLWESKK